MAQTKRRRQTKHRGNAAGVVESRGRTGRPPTAAEKGGQGRDAARARARRLERYDRPPTWRGAFWRALAAAALMVLVTLLLTHQTAQALVLFPVVLAIYVPISFYTDQWMFKRRQRAKSAREAKAKGATR
jgi:hypothetical protein